MSKLVECPNCLGTGEELIKGKYMKKCKYCDGTGKTEELIASAFLDGHLYDTIE